MIRRKKNENILKYKLIYTGLILFLYITGRCIPLYGIDTMRDSFSVKNAEDMLMQSIGGDAYRLSIFALGISLCVISSILVQIVMACKNSVSKTKVSPVKFGYVSVLLTFVIAILQALMRLSELRFVDKGNMLVVSKIIVMTEMITGVMLILWLSNRNTKYGIGGRITLILVNILDGIMSTISGYTLQSLTIPLMVSAMVILITVFMENTEKHIPVQRISIHNIYADKNYMAVKLNPVGVMPVMFSTALFMLCQLLISLLIYFYPNYSVIVWWQENLSLSRYPGIVVYLGGIHLLTIVFSFILIGPKDVTEQFLKSGDSIVDIHAGHDTRKYLRRTMWRISLFSATIMSLCIGVSLVLQVKGNIDSTLVMLPSSAMMLTGLWCNIYRETVVIKNYDSYQPLL